MNSEQISKIAAQFLSSVKAKDNSWIKKLLLWAAGFLIAGAMMYAVYKKNKELAGLIHEKNVAEENRLRAESEKRVAVNTQEISKLETEISNLDTQVLNHKMLIASREAEARNFKEKLDAVKDWKSLNSAFGDK